MSKKQVKTWIDDNISDMVSLESEGDERDWTAYDELRDENGILKAVLNG